MFQQLFSVRLTFLVVFQHSHWNSSVDSAQYLKRPLLRCMPATTKGIGIVQATTKAWLEFQKAATKARLEKLNFQYTMNCGRRRAESTNVSAQQMHVIEDGTSIHQSVGNIDLNTENGNLSFWVGIISPWLSSHAPRKRCRLANTANNGHTHNMS